MDLRHIIQVSALLGVLLTVAVAQPPTITHHPIDMTVVRNEPVTLDCRARGEPSPRIRWFRGPNGARVRTTQEDPSSHRILLPDGSLFFLRAMQGKREQDAGVYWCVADNERGEARSRNATLSVSYLRDDFRVAPTDTDVLLGESVKLHCSPPKGSPEPIVKWLKDGESLDLSSGKRISIDPDGNLSIDRVTRDDAGKYQCSAENSASSRITKPVKLQILETPSFLTRPETQSVLVGSNLLIRCQATGDPHPDITWTKATGDELDFSRVKIVHGKGLRIDGVRPADQGAYVCKAKNSAGAVSARADVEVLQLPELSVRPPAVVEIKPGHEKTRLDCLATGAPTPKVFWMREGESRRLLRPGATIDNMRVNLDGSLVIEGPADERTKGYYSCFAVSPVGSTIARTKLILSDDNSLEDEDIFDFDLEEARLASLEKGISMKKVTSISPTSLKVSWSSLPVAKRYIQGYRVWYRPVAALDWYVVEVDSPIQSSCILQGLQEATEYQAFVQPYYRGIIGRPSEIGSGSTKEAPPSAAPVITTAKVLNATSIFIAWETVAEVHRNGDIKSYEISIKESADPTADLSKESNPRSPQSFLRSVAPSVNEITLFFEDLQPEKTYTVQIAATNGAGTGPLSEPPLEMTIAPRIVTVNTTVSSYSPERNNMSQITWVIVAAAVLFFVVLLLLGVIFYYKRVGFGAAGGKTSGYLEASTEDFHHCQMNRSLQRHQELQSARHHPSIWLDRQWNTGEFGAVHKADEAELDGHDDEKHSHHGSERKLLEAPHHGSNSNSDTEYTYVDGKQPLQGSSRHNTSFTASSGSGSSAGSSGRRLGQNQSSRSPEPYATTDIFRQPSQPERVYAAPVFHYKRSASSNKSKDFLPPKPSPSYAVSCDNLSKGCSPSSQQAAAVRPAANLLDILPPPPVHPPPPPAYVSQESVISPKYLFAHPMYQAQTTHYQRVYPVPQHPAQQAPNRYEEILASSASSGDSEAEAFARLLPQASSRLVRPPARQQSMEEFERDLANELQIFNEAITKFSERKRGASGRRRDAEEEQESRCDDEMLSSCDADQEDNLSMEEEGEIR